MDRDCALQEKVATAFRERNIPVKRDDIAAVVSDPETCKWIENHLGPSNLLSKEESTVYAKLEASGALRSILQGQEIASTRPFVEDEIRDAIAALKGSTAAIEHQTEKLRLQCKELKSQTRSSGQIRLRGEKSWSQLGRMHALEKQQVDVAIEDIAHDLERNLGSAQTLLSTESNTLLPQLAAKLKDDDRSLQSMEKIASSVQVNGEDEDLSARATDLTAKLAGYLVEEIHSRLDRIYLETTRSRLGSAGADEKVDEAGLASLNEEISSLYSEIEILAEMTMQQQFKVPILRALQNRSTEAHSSSQQQLEEVLDTLIQLTLSTEKITERLNNRQSHRTALNYLSTKYKTEQELKQLESTNRKSVSLQQRRASRLSYAPSTPRNPERNMSLPGVHESKVLEQLLRRLGVSVADLLETGLTEAASASLDDKKQRMLEMLQNLQSTAESPLSAYLGTADQAAELLHSALHADSDFGTSMVDRAQEEKLAALEDTIGALRKGIDGLNVDILNGGDKAQERFMERWG
ncbi:hypothetical protein FQN50_005621 [Emmonsiellopsis sp. PD_5]|nr:hypothetical protein FQN50_005621 [Emmonsiellopsis sp. PD_5]